MGTSFVWSPPTRSSWESILAGDAVICAGYPGSVAGTWQRFGRAGRRGETSVAVLVAGSSAIDQYIVQNPDTLFDGNIESARIDPLNTEIVVQHLKCAAFEVPFLAGETYGGLGTDDTTAALRFLADHGVVHELAGRFHWAADAYPANHVSLRSVGWDNFVIIDKRTGSSIAELDWRATPTMLHEQAIYQHDGEQYQVETLDYENHKAFVAKVEPDYFTQALSHRKVSVIEETARKSTGCAVSQWGDVSVVEKVVGYKKIKFHTHENAGYGDVRLPDIQMHTTSFWLTLPEALGAELGLGRAAAIEGVRGIAAALETVATLALMCDPRDLGQTLGDDGDDGDAAQGSQQTERGQALVAREKAPAVGSRVPRSGFDPERSSSLTNVPVALDCPSASTRAPASCWPARSGLSQAVRVRRAAPSASAPPIRLDPKWNGAACENARNRHAWQASDLTQELAGSDARTTALRSLRRQNKIVQPAANAVRPGRRRVDRSRRNRGFVFPCIPTRATL